MSGRGGGDESATFIKFLSFGPLFSSRSHQTRRRLQPVQTNPRMTTRDPRHDFSLYGGAEVLPPSLRNRSTSLSTSTSSSSATPDSLSEDEAETRATTPGEELTEEARSFKLPGEEWAPKSVNPPQDGTDFLWMMTEEPHRSRRKAIMKAHPEASLHSSSQNSPQINFPRISAPHSSEHSLTHLSLYRSRS